MNTAAYMQYLVHRAQVEEYHDKHRDNALKLLMTFDLMAHATKRQECK